MADITMMMYKGEDEATSRLAVRDSIQAAGAMSEFEQEGLYLDDAMKAISTNYVHKENVLSWLKDLYAEATDVEQTQKILYICSELGIPKDMIYNGS